MAATFPTTLEPTIASQKSHTPRVKQIAFGNGYKQIYGDGLNSDTEKWSLGWTVNDTNKQTIEDFFSTAAGYNYFNWTSPETGATQKQYICPTWMIKPIGANFYEITATFEEWTGLV
jgi:phage-related protein